MCPSPTAAATYPSVVAVDWSGALATSSQRRHIWLAEAETAHGKLQHLEGGRTREEVVEYLCSLGGSVLVGLDFSFSFPEWFVARHADTVEEFWGVVAAEGDVWLHECIPPFWGRPGRACPPWRAGEDALRRTESDYGAAGPKPKPVFQIGGAGSVGTASVRGIPHLLRLRDAGFAVWPFQPPGPRTVVEIYPRWFSGPVTKSTTGGRREVLDRYGDRILPQHRAVADATDDAFDAAVSALGMADAVAAGKSPGACDGDDISLVEGRIWLPHPT